MLVLRETNGKRQAATFDVNAIQKGRADDPVLQSGDIVVAGNSAIKTGFNAILKALPVAGCLLLVDRSFGSYANHERQFSQRPKSPSRREASSLLPLRTFPQHATRMDCLPAIQQPAPKHPATPISRSSSKSGASSYKRKWLIVSIAAAILAIGAVRTLMKVPLYTATVRLQIDRNVAKIVNTEGVLPVENGDYDFMRTQYELLKSRNMAERVVSSLTLGDDPDLLKPRELSLLGLVTGLFSPLPDRPVLDGSAASAAAVGVVMGNLTVQPVMGSRLVDVSYSDTSPERAQRIANAYADAFMAANLRQALSSQCFRQDLSRRQNSAVKAAPRGIGEAAARFRARPADRRRQRQGLDRRKQSRHRQCGARQSDRGAHEERAALAAGRSRRKYRSAATSCRQVDRGFTRQAQGPGDRISTKAADLQAGLPGDGANQEPDG